MIKRPRDEFEQIIQSENKMQATSTSTSGEAVLSETQSYVTLADGSVVGRELTELETEVLARHDAAAELISHLASSGSENPASVYMPSMLKGALFCGHLVTDMDSIAGALGAADLYQGMACRASEVNSETKFCLEKWGIEQPPRVEDMLTAYPSAGVCLVDHQQMSQLNPAIPTSRIVGVIDHHALQSETIVTEVPIFIDIRPWGSMSTVSTPISFKNVLHEFSFI
jgi:hypothetical protein